MTFCMTTVAIFLVFCFIGYRSGDHLSAFNNCSEIPYHNVWLDPIDDRKESQNIAFLEELNRFTMESAERSMRETEKALEESDNACRESMKNLHYINHMHIPGC